MTTPDDDYTRIRESLGRLMQVEPPRRDPDAADRAHWVRTVAVALSVFVATAAVLTGGLILLRHPGGGAAPAKPTLGVVTAPTPTAMPTFTPPSATPIPAYLPASGPVCVPSQLEMRLGNTFSALSNGITYLILTDRGDAPCVLRGTPRVTLLGDDGRPLAVPSIIERASGYIPTYPNNGVGLIPLADQGAPPGPSPEGGIRGQASLPLQYHHGCTNSIAAAAVDLGGATLTVHMPYLGPPPGEPSDCQLTSLYVSPFQPAEYLPS